jgi:hypothetical protein
LPGLERWFEFRDDLLDRRRHSPEIFILHASIDVIDRLNVGLVEDGLNGNALCCRDIAKPARDRRTVDVGAARQRAGQLQCKSPLSAIMRVARVI